MQFEFREHRVLTPEEADVYAAEGKSRAMDLPSEVEAALAAGGRPVDPAWRARRDALVADLEAARASTADVAEGDNLALVRVGQRILALQDQLNALNRDEPQANIDARVITRALGFLLQLKGLGVYDAPFTVDVDDTANSLTISITRGDGPQFPVSVLSGGEINPEGEITTVTPEAGTLSAGGPQ
jgi:hypothetical protein